MLSRSRHALPGPERRRSQADRPAVADREALHIRGAEPPAPEELAAQVGMSPFALLRGFRAKLRLAPDDSAVVRNAVAIAVSTGVYGIAFGAAGVAAGLGVGRTSVLSLFLFSGASQFALVGVLGSGGSVLAAVVSALLLGARNGLYGLRLSGLLGVRGIRRFGVAQGVIDETTAMSVVQPDRRLARFAFAITFVLLYLCCNVGTVIGAFGARAVGDPSRYGLDVAAPAALVALLAPRLQSSRIEVAVALGGAAIAVLATPFSPAGAPIVCAAFAVLLVARK